MTTFLMVLFIILCCFLALFIFIQKGKGDMGLGGLAGSQSLFGGSGGQSFFEKITWVLGFLFILGALVISILKTNYRESSRIKDYTIPVTQQLPAENVKENKTEAPAAPESAPEKQEKTNS